MVDSELAFEIWENRDRILSNLKKKDIDEYRYLKEKFESSGGSSDPEFQARFKKSEFICEHTPDSRCWNIFLHNT